MKKNACLALLCLVASTSCRGLSSPFEAVRAIGGSDKVRVVITCENGLVIEGLVDGLSTNGSDYVLKIYFTTEFKWWKGELDRAGVTYIERPSINPLKFQYILIRDGVKSVVETED